MIADLDESLQGTLGDTTESLKSIGDTNDVILEVVGLLGVDRVRFRRMKSAHTHTVAQCLHTVVDFTFLRSRSRIGHSRSSSRRSSRSASIITLTLHLDCAVGVVVSVPADIPKKKHFQTNQG